MLRRKLRKLARDPERFLLDYLKKRANIDLKPAGGQRDFLTDLSSPMERVIEALTAAGVTLQPMRAHYGHESRFAVRDTDMARITEVLKGLCFDGYNVCLQHDAYQQFAVHFERAGITFHKPTLVLDPWYRRNGFIRSDSTSPTTSLVLEENRESTVWSGEEIRASLEEANSILHSSLTSIEFPIDVVYTWVDGSDPQWLQRRAPFLRDASGHHEDNHDTRYESLDELRYSLRSIASFAPWVRKTFIVTDGQKPGWLTDSERVVIVDHRELFEDQSCLPTFNSHAIEAKLYRIPGLAEHFVYFNDDMLLLNPSSPLDFFHSNGLSKSFYEPLSNISGSPSVVLPGFANAARNGSALLQERFGRSAHSYHLHTPYALRRSVFEELWNVFPAELAATCRTRFRSPKDISTASFLYHYYAHEIGKSVPGSIVARTIGLGDALLGYALGELATDRETLALCLNGQPQSHPLKAELVTQFLQSRFPQAAPWET